MKTTGRTLKVFLPLFALALAWILPASSSAQDRKAEQDLRITIGGFVQDHPEGGKLAGVCGTDNTRNVMNCDIYNGLLDWTVTEIILAVVWSPYGNDENKRFYRADVSIEPLKTERVTIRLGLQLPSDDMVGRHWHFLIASARGYRVK